MHDQLRQLYQQVGKPSLARLKKHADLAGHPVSKATFGNLLKEQGKPRLDTVEAFVIACASYADGRKPPLRLPPGAVDLNRWRTRYTTAYPSTAAAGDAAFAVERRAYLARLRERYGRVDLEVLTPLTEQDEHPPVGLREVFVTQTVRADPPPVELPRELVRRLVEAGELSRDELPDGVDREALVKVQQAYRERPARSVVQVLTESEQQRLVLLGDPGAGKSTLARYLALTLADASAEGPLTALAGWLPLMVELRTYADARWREHTFLDLIDYLHATEGLGLPKPILDTFLRQDGRAVVIFDGLDELFDPQLRDAVTHQIAGFAARYPRPRIVVTSRVIGYRRAILDAAGFAHYMLQDLDPGQIETFVTCWYQIACPDNSIEAARLRERLLVAVNDSVAVRELAGNPMLLTILSIIGRRRELPRDRRAVYQHAVSVLVEQWDPSKHLRDTRIDQGMPYIDYEDKLELLRLVARRMQDGPAGLAGNHISGLDLLAEFDTYLRQRYELPPDRAKPVAKAMLDQFRERNFVLSRFGAEIYGFVHRAFLEYLAAEDIGRRFAERELTENELIRDVFGRRWSDPAWEEVLLLVTGMISERFAGQVIDHLLAADPLWFLRPHELPRHALLAVQCIGEVRKLGVLSTQSLAIIDTVTSLLETAHEREIRFDSSLTRAVKLAVLPVFTALGPHWAGRDRYQDWYLLRGQFLSMGFPDSVFSLAAHIGAILLADSLEFCALLHTQAILSPDKDVRRAAVQALATGWRDDRDTVPWLRERATTDPDGDVRQAAVQALAATGWRDDPDTVPWLRERATTDSDGDVRQAAVQALATGWRDDPDTVPWLRERATTDSDGYVRQAAVQALAATGWRDDPDTVPWLRERATTDSDGYVRQAAVQALAATGWRDDPDTVPWLRERATTDSDEYVRQAAVQALAATGWRDDPDTVPWLRERATTDSDEYVRQAAVQALATGWRDDPDTVPLLRERATTDSDEYVRQAAVQALATGWRDDPDTVPLLRERATTDSDEYVRQAAVQALATGWRDDPDTVPLLRERATTDQHGDVRLAAVQALATGWRDDPDTVPLLRERATTDSDGDIRRAAVQALATGWRDDPDTVPLLRERATTDQHGDVRLAAVQALATGWRDDPDTVPLLRERATTDSDGDIRRAAVQALATGWRDDPDTVPLLRERATTDQHGDVRLAAVQALATGWRDDPDTVPLLRERATTDSDGDIRRAAVQALATGWRDDPDTVPLLRERATTDQHGDVRRAAVHALATGWRDDPDTVPLLRERATTDSDGDIRRAAVQALATGWRDDPDTLSWLREHATDPDEYVRQAAVQALATGWRDDDRDTMAPLSEPPGEETSSPQAPAVPDTAATNGVQRGATGR